MGSKSDERQRRQAAKLAKFEETKTASINKVVSIDTPRLYKEPLGDLNPHLAPNIAIKIASDKTPRAIEGGRFKSNVTWCINKADIKDEWSWAEVRAWEQEEWVEYIHPHLKQMEQITWAEVDKLSSGSGHKMHHGHEITDLVKEAQYRWKIIGLEEYDSVFRFRLGGTKRAWGYIVQSHFFMVWWERHHKIYPVDN
jgi:hypothetical protein